MTLRLLNKISLQGFQECSIGLLFPALSNSVNLQQIRHRTQKHWNPKFKWHRGMKVIKVELPRYNENVEDLSEEEMRARLKERGLLPHRPWVERPFFLSCTGGVFEAYVPPEGDGKVSPITAQGAKQKLQFLEKKSKSMMAIRKIRTYEEEFDTPEFCKHAEEIYKKSHEFLMDKDTTKLLQYVTERAYPEIIHNIEFKTIRWNFIKNIELPRVVHARCTDVISKENVFGQVTVRFHTQQSLAIYDRFGRLIHGSEIIAKDVLEYVVFEKHLANEYGVWRIHSKIIPDWLPPKEPSYSTYKRIDEYSESKEVTTEKQENLPESKKDEKPAEAIAA